MIEFQDTTHNFGKQKNQKQLGKNHNEIKGNNAHQKIFQSSSDPSQDLAADRDQSRQLSTGSPHEELRIERLKESYKDELNLDFAI